MSNVFVSQDGKTCVAILPPPIRPIVVRRPGVQGIQGIQGEGVPGPPGPPGLLQSVEPGVGISIDSDVAYAPVVSLDAGTLASLGKADSAVQPDDLADVAASGSYDDLTDKPHIPADPVNADWDASGGLAEILNKPTLGNSAALDVGTGPDTVAAGDHTHADASDSAAGFMSADDKAKLDSVDLDAIFWLSITS